MFGSFAMARPERLLMAESNRTIIVRNGAMEFHKISSWASGWKAKVFSRGDSEIHFHLMPVFEPFERNLPLP
jgi:hypothetical protein